MASQPHFLAVAAAFVTAAKEMRLFSAVDDFPEETESSRPREPKEVKDFVDGASDLNEA